MPTREVILPAGRALIPTYAKIAHDEAESRKAFLQVFGLIVMYALPAGIGISVAAPDLVPLLLGDQWTSAIPFFQWLGIFAGFEAILLGVRPYFLARGGERAYALSSVGYACALVPAIVAAGYMAGPIAIAMTRTGLLLLMVFVILMIVARMRYAPFGSLLAQIWRPAMASAAMWLAIDYMPDLEFGGHALTLVRDVAVGAGVFVATVLLLWFAARQPDGPERNVLTFARQRLRRLLG